MNADYYTGISTGLLGGAIISIFSGVSWILNIGQVVIGVGFLLYSWHVADKTEDA